MFDAVDIALSFLIIKNNKIIDCNLNAVNLFGYEKKADLIGLRPYDLSPYLQDDNEESIKKGREYIKRVRVEKNVNFTWRHTKRNGETFLAYINLINIKNILFALITNLDEVYESEAKIKEKDEMYKLLFEQNKNMILFIDPLNLQITEANKAALAFYGSDLKSKSFSDIIAAKENIKENIDLVLTNKRNVFFSQHLNVNNEIRDVEVHIFAISINNKDYLIAMVYDTSDIIKQNLIIDTFIRQSPYPIAVLDNEQRVININDKFTDLFQYKKEELLGKNLNQFVTSTEYRNELNENIDKVFTENFIRINTLRKRKDNQLINVEIFAFPITYHDKIIGAYVHYIDITEKIKNQTQLEVFKKVLENNNEGIMITDANERIEWVNHAFTKITGYELNEVIGKTPKILRSYEHDEKFYQKMWEEIRKKHHWHGEVWNKNKAGEIFPEWLNIYAIKNNDEVTNYVAIIKDLSESKLIDQKMRVLAQKDALTGLYNRVYFMERINQIINQRDITQFSLLFLDLDSFKEINDTLGHHAGDKFLIEISRRLQEFLKDDQLIARYGGDEFVILLKNYADKDKIINISREILEIINRPYDYEENLLYVSASLGISIYPKDGKSSDELVQNADIAMYVSKNAHDEKITFYDPIMRLKIDEKFKIATLLRKAINNKAYTLIFNPIYDLHSNKINAYEVNIEWENQLKNYEREKQREIAMQTGQINQVFDFIFTDICKLLANNNCTIPFSINITIEQLEQSAFLNLIKERIKEYQINPSLIEFMFINNYLENITRVSENIKELHKLGFNFGLDKFGLNNSSISQLRTYHINRIKLTSILTKSANKENFELIKLYRLITRELNIKLSAKKITQENELQFIKKLELDEAQGMYFSKPLTLKQVKDLLKKD